MAKTFLNIYTEVGYLIGDEGTDTQTKIKAWINDIVRDVNSRYDWPWLLVEGATFNFADGTKSYVLTTAIASTLRKVKRVYRKDSNNNIINLIKWSWRRVWENLTHNTSNEAAPTHYAMKDKTLYPYPIADTTYAGYVDYWKRGAELASGSDEPDCPDEWRHVFVYGAAWMGFQFQGDHQNADIYLKKYEATLKEMAQDIERDEDLAPRWRTEQEQDMIDQERLRQD